MSAGPGVDEQQVLAAADALVETGLRNAGYRYVVVDDGWSAPERDRYARLVPSAEPALDADSRARYATAPGRASLNLYTAATTRTCARRRGRAAGYIGRWGYERVDAAIRAAQGIDLDGMGAGGGETSPTSAPRSPAWPPLWPTPAARSSAFTPAGPGSYRPGAPTPAFR